MQDASGYFKLFVTSYKVRDFMFKLLFLASPDSSAEAEWQALALSPTPHLGHQEEEAPCLNSHKGATQASTVLGPLCFCCPVLPGPSSLPQALLTLRPDQLSARLPGWQPRASRGRGRPHRGTVASRWVLWGQCCCTVEAILTSGCLEALGPCPCVSVVDSTEVRAIFSASHSLHSAPLTSS